MNCLKRGVECEQPARFLTTSQVASERFPHTNTSDVDILARLERLETIVLGDSKSSPPSDVEHGIQHVELLGLPTSSQTSLAVKGFGELQNVEFSDSRMEGLASSNVSNLPGLSERMTFRIGPIQQAMFSNARCIWLPPKEEANWLFEAYMRNVTHFYHVIYVPSVRMLMDGLYLRVLNSQSATASHVGLILSMCASSTYFLTPGSNRIALFASEEDASRSAVAWTKATLDVLEHSRRTTCGSIEDVQATIILSFVLYNLEGFSSRARLLSYNAFVLARELSLHKVDSLKQEEQTAGRDLIEVEVSRRLWWHIVSTDWMIALQGGPQEGTYLANPKQMSTCRPLNIYDEDLRRDVQVSERPLSEPTPMAYFLQRLRLANICRNIVDSVPSLSSLSETNYSDVLALDAELEDFLKQLPTFFLLDEESLTKSQPPDSRLTYLPVQRVLITVHAHMKRCRLNQPFLTKALQDSRYTRSRNVCLGSARAIIRICQQTYEGQVWFVSADRRLLAVVYYIFVATVVLVVDFQQVQDREGANQRRAEISGALKILEDVQDQSAVAETFLHALTDVLRMHQVRWKQQESHEMQTGRDYGPTTTPGLAEILQQSQLGNEQVGFDEIWQEFVDFGPNLDSPEWDKLFSNLDAVQQRSKV